MGGDALFQLFAAALAEPEIANAACRQLLAQMLGPDLLVHWADLADLKPVQTLARVVACAVPGSGPTLRDPGLWRSALGEEAECQEWWLALLARHGLCSAGASISPEDEFRELIVSAFRSLRDRYASDAYLRHMKVVSSSGRRLRERYDNLELVAVGPAGFTSTYTCLSQSSREWRTCRQIRKDCLAVPSDQVRTEIDLLQSIKHPSLPILVESFEDFNSLYIIAEAAEGLPLMGFLKMRYSAAKPISEAWLAQVVRHILEALQHCHSLRPRPVVHGDLRIEQLMLSTGNDMDSTPHVLVTDLGLAGLVPPPPPPHFAANAVAPPVAGGKGEPVSPLGDVWCCGAILFLLLTGSHPCGERECFGRPLFHPSLPHGEVDLGSLQHASTGAESLCAQMLVPDAQARPAAAECVQHPWLDDCLLMANAEHLVPLQVLERLVAQWEGSLLRSQLQSKAADELGCSVFVRGGPVHRVGPAENREEACSWLQELGFAAPTAKAIVSAFQGSCGGSVALRRFAAGCEQVAEAKLDSAIWHAFVAVGADDRGVLDAAQLEQVLGGGGGSAAERTIQALVPGLTASEVLRESAQTCGEVTFEALKELVLRRHQADHKASPDCQQSLSKKAQQAGLSTPGAAIRWRR